MKRPDSKRVEHITHLVTHLAYLVLVTFHSSYYPVAAGVLAIVIVVGEVHDKFRKDQNHDGYTP